MLGEIYVAGCHRIDLRNIGVVADLNAFDD